MNGNIRDNVLLCEERIHIAARFVFLEIDILWHHVRQHLSHSHFETEKKKGFNY